MRALSMCSTLLVLVVACAPEDEPVVTGAAAVVDARGLFCPPGTSPDLARGYCVDETNAYGPFTRVMRDRCVSAGGGPACDATLRFEIDGHVVEIPRWNRAFADALRGPGVCPAGATRDASLGVCVEGADAFGPFPTAILALCVVHGGGDACYTNRWSKAFYAGLAAVRRPNHAAARTLEYHDVVPGADGSLPPGVVVTTGHLTRLAAAYSPARYLVTFDDGYVGVFARALPVLAARQVPAVAAIIVEATRDSGSPDALPGHMSRAELTALVKAGWALALHSGTVAEHELDYARMAEVLRGGVVGSPGRAPVQVSLDDPRALDWLGDLTHQPGAPSARLLAQLRADRARVVELVASGASPDEAVIVVLADRLAAERRRLAELAGMPALAIDTFVYPHSESNALVRAAAAHAGFVRGYAGGPIGDPDDPFDLPRTWMNDATPLP